MTHRLALAAALVLAGAPAFAQSPERIRGTITSVNGGTLHIARNGGGDDTVTLSDRARVVLVEPSSLDAIKGGSFIGTAARTEADGSMTALEVHVFPESMRGSGEGHRPFDLGPRSTMTNGTVGQEVTGKTGQRLTVRYKGGEKAITIPPNTPVVTFEPGTPSSLTQGAHVIAFVKSVSGALAATNILVGKDGLVPPM